MSQSASTAATAPTQAEDLPTPPSRARAMEPAKSAVRPGAVAVIGPVLAILLVAVGVVAVRDALVSSGLLTGSPWLAQFGSQLNGLKPAAWTVPVGAVLVLVGLWMLMAALRPRPRTATALRSTTGVFLSPKDVTRLSETAAEQVDGVLSVKASATRRAVTLRVTTTGDTEVADQVKTAVTDRLAPLQSPPSVKVRTHGDNR